jgi:hypothetical protein
MFRSDFLSAASKYPHKSGRHRPWIGARHRSSAISVQNVTVPAGRSRRTVFIAGDAHFENAGRNSAPRPRRPAIRRFKRAVSRRQRVGDGHFGPGARRSGLPAPPFRQNRLGNVVVLSPEGGDAERLECPQDQTFFGYFFSKK